MPPLGSLLDAIVRCCRRVLGRCRLRRRCRREFGQHSLNRCELALDFSSMVDGYVGQAVMLSRGCGHGVFFRRFAALGPDAFADFAASAASFILNSAAFTSWSSLMRAKAAIRARRRTLGGLSVLSGNGSLLFGKGSGPGAACWESRGNLAGARGTTKVVAAACGSAANVNSMNFANGGNVPR